MSETSLVVRRLLDTAGTTYADEAGIRLRNEPMPLFQLLALAMLASKPIGADVAARAAREVFQAGIRTPTAVRDAHRTSLIDAFGRAGYARYDESSATRLRDMAEAVLDRYGGDLRKLAAEAREDRAEAIHALQRFKGIGDTGSGIFMREVQDVWPWVRPYFDDRAIAGAEELGLPTKPDELAELAPRSAARLAAALTRVSLSSDLRDHVTEFPTSKE
ncbi:MAG: endonuclease [Mycobacterium sp.]